MATRTRDLGGDKERNQENCNSRVELFFTVMLNLSPRRMDLFFMYGEESCGVAKTRVRVTQRVRVRVEGERKGKGKGKGKGDC